MDLKNIKFKKELVLNEIIFSANLFNAPASKKANYVGLLKVNMISPVTGLHHQSIKNTRKAIRTLNREIEDKINNGIHDENLDKLQKSLNELQNSPVEHLNVVKTCYLTQDQLTSEFIEGKIKELAAKLYGDYEDEIRSLLQENPNPGRYNMSTLYNIYGISYLSGLPKCCKKRQDYKAKTLKDACAVLNEVPAIDIKKNQLSELFKIKRYADNRTLIEGFFTFLNARGIWHASNPVTDFFTSKKTYKLKKAQHIYPENEQHLPIDIEHTLHDKIAKNINKRDCLAVPLAKGFRMTIPQILNVKWEDVHIDNGNVYIEDYKEELTGGIHCFTRPVLKECADLIIMRRDYLVNTIANPSKLNGMHLVTVGASADSITEQKRILSKNIRDILKDVGVTDDMLHTINVDGGPKALGGSAMSLLHQHYDFILENRCGINRNSSIGKYLRGMAVNDTTTNYYRSLSDLESGLPLLFTIMRRDESFYDYNTKESQVLVTDDHAVVIDAVGPGRKTTMSMGKCFVPKGTIITISSPFGITGEVHTYSVSNSSNVRNKKDLY